MVRKIVQKRRIRQIRTPAKNGVQFKSMENVLKRKSIQNWEYFKSVGQFALGGFPNKYF